MPIHHVTAVVSIIEREQFHPLLRLQEMVGKFQEIESAAVLTIIARKIFAKSN